MGGGARFVILRRRAAYHRHNHQLAYAYDNTCRVSNTLFGRCALRPEWRAPQAARRRAILTNGQNLTPIFVKLWHIHIWVGNVRNVLTLAGGEPDIQCEKRRMDRVQQDSSKNIINMARFQNELRFPVIAEVEAYWNGLRGTRLMPRRSEIDPRGIERALEYAFILERIAPGIARLRIAGSHLTELMGMEVRGMPVSALFTPTARKTISEKMEEVFDGPSIVELDIQAEGGIGKPVVEGRLLLLPLKSDLGDVTRILGCFVTRGSVGRTPRRFNITGTRSRAIGVTGATHTPDEGALPELEAAPQLGFSAPSTVFSDEPLETDPGHSRSNVTYLRLVKNDD